MSFFGVPLSGLVASQDQLQSISNNLANLGTDGYKDQNDTFADIFAQTGAANGAEDPLQTGLGASLVQTNSNFTNGSINSTGIASNMALSGDGFFITQQTNGSTAYTRAGDFTTNNAGYLVDSTGAQVLGFPAANGVVNTAAVLQPLQVGTGAVDPATPTSNFSSTNSLSSAATAGDQYNSTAISIYDSLGNSHILSTQFTKLASPPNTWSYSLSLPAADVTSGATQIATGTMTFSPTGSLISVTEGSGAPIDPPPSSISVNGIGLTDGANALSLQWNLTDSSGGSLISQTSVNSTTSATSQDGNAAGTLISNTSYSVDEDGTIEGAYTNGKTIALGQVAVANFVNTQGLQRTGGNDYVATAGSGPALVGSAGTGGRGTITGGSVEGSNVDTATEFSKLIVAQQDYQANAKTVTTFDQVSQATIAMITD